ncbi:MAG TPA: transcriptional regulator, partial [Dokdonella sp.]
RYRFDDFELDTLSRELRKAGAAIPLPLKSFDCLVYLLERRDRAVGRDELISAVWGRIDVSDALLGQTLARARRAVDDTGGEQRVIRTVPRFGYRWVVPVVVLGGDEAVASSTLAVADAAAGAGEPAAAAAPPGAIGAVRAPASPARRWSRAIAVAVALIALAAAVLAVFRFGGREAAPVAAIAADPDLYLALPVAVHDGDPASRWIRLGAMDYLASALRERGRLRVLPSDQAVAYLAGRSDAQLADPVQRLQLAQAAGAAWVLAATVQRIGNGWSFELDVQDTERTLHYQANAGTPLQAADLALGDFLAHIGRANTPAATRPPTLVELQQRVDAAFLEGDMHEAGALIERAPPELQRDPGIAVRAAEIDERAGRLELAGQQFARIAGASDSPLTVRGRALYGLCAIAFWKNEGEVAQRHCNDALALLARDPDPMLLGRAYMLRAVLDDQAGRADEAMAGFGLARIEWRRAGNLPGEASVDGDEGLALTRRGRFAEAVAAFDRAAVVFDRFGVRDHLASSLAAKSDAQRMMLDLDGALASSAQAWQLTPRIENAKTVRAIGHSRALALLAGGHLDEAAHVIGRFDPAAPSAPPEFAVLRSQWLTAQGRFGEATEHADEIIERVLSPADPTTDASVSEALDVFIDAALRAGDLALADHLLARLNAAGADVQDPDREFLAQLAQARLLAARADAAGADVHFKSALDIALRDSRPDQVTQSASAYVFFLLEHQRLQDAQRIAGRITLYADKDYDAARAMAALYEKLGDRRSADLARGRISQLAGQRVSLTAAAN